MKKITILSILLIFTFGIFAQTKITNHPIISSILDSTLLLIEAEYTLRDTNGGEFGRNNSYYSMLYSIGLRVEDNLFLNERAIKPWDFDDSLIQADLGKTKYPSLSRILATPHNIINKKEVALLDIDSNLVDIQYSGLLSLPSLEKNLIADVSQLWLITFHLNNSKGASFANMKRIIYHLEKEIPTIGGEIESGVEIEPNFIGSILIGVNFRTGHLKLDYLTLPYLDKSKKKLKFKLEPQKSKLTQLNVVEESAVEVKQDSVKQTPNPIIVQNQTKKGKKKKNKKKKKKNKT